MSKFFSVASIGSRLLRYPSPIYPSPIFIHSTPIETLSFEGVQTSKNPINSTALVLHGLLGSGRNWRSFVQNLISHLEKSSSSAGWRMILVDLRNHGRSTGLKGLDPPHDMVNAARDLANLVKSRDWAWPDVVIGHSMGGKVALEYAASCARGDYGESASIPKQLWVLDSVPGVVNSDKTDGEIEKILNALQNLPPYLPSRKWVVDHMLNLGFSKLVSKWIASNLNNESEHVVWAFDLPAAIEMFNSFRERSYWSLLEHPPKGLEIAVVQAENSDRWSQHDIQRLKSLSEKREESDEGKLSYYMLPESGHWVHVDNQKGLLDIMAPNFCIRA